MRTFTFGKALAVALLLLAPLFAHAAGLGRLNVQSSLGQPLSAEIDLVAVRGDEASTLVARLASPDAYQQANLQYNAGLTGLKISIEKRSNGQSYIKIAGSRPVNEPFIDLLIELTTGSGGKLVREYTALLDPPGYGQQAAQAAPAAPAPAPESRPIVVAPAAPAPKAARAPVVATASAQEYGPIAKGETLGRIAASLKPQGVSLEQMLVGLYRSNPDAFVRKNMNLVKSGKILRIPDAQELAAITQGEAVQEYRAQVADWRAYSGRVADAAAQAPEGAATARGRITAKVDDPAAAEGKDVVKLSKGEPGKGGKPLTGAALETAAAENEVARKQELADVKVRITQLEKTVKDGQKLAELKSSGMTEAQQKAEAARADAAKADAAKAASAKSAEPAKPAEPAKAETKLDAAPAAKPDAAPAPMDEAKKDVAAVPTNKPAEEAKPAPKPKLVVPPPPPPEPSLMDMAMENLPLIGGGVLAVVLGGLGLAALRRRRAGVQDDDEPMQVAPTMGGAAAAGDVAGRSDTTAMAVAPASDDVDPVAEAEVYIAYGRDGQAEEILKEAMSRDPAREDVQVKLAEVYATRRDAAGFGVVADSMYGLTGGGGENWMKVAALGYVLDPSNPLYEAGRDAAPIPLSDDSPTGTDLDFDLGGDTAGTPDIALEAGPAGQATEMGGLQELAAAADAGVAPAEPAMPDFNLDAGAQPDIALEASPAEASSIDFNFELPPVDAPAAPAAPAAPVADAGLDFKIDVGDLNINLDDPSTAAAPAEARDGHWYDVQQKFDLAKAYQEMGDNDGAREILQEVLKEGDNDQKDQAQKLLGTLG